MQKITILNWVATISFIGVLFVNALSILQPLNGMNTGQVSDIYPALFRPAPVTFSIWGVIYLLLTGFICLSWQRQDSFLIERILPWFILSCVLNVSWIFAWHFLLPLLSVFIMLGLLATLFRIFSIIKAEMSIDGLEAMFVVLPFRMYFAWICVATIANVAALQVHWDLQGGRLAQEISAIIMMTIAALLAAQFVRLYRAWSFAVVTLWALFGICLRWENGEHPMVVFAGFVLIVILTIFLFSKILEFQKSHAS